LGNSDWKTPCGTAGARKKVPDTFFTPRKLPDRGTVRASNDDTNRQGPSSCGVVGEETMARLLDIFSKLLARRTRKRRWVYAPILGIVFLFFMWATEEGLTALWYIPIMVIIIVQYLRPTLLLWTLLLAMFGAYTIAVLGHASFLRDYYGVPFGLLPTIALLWAYPKRGLVR